MERLHLVEMEIFKLDADGTIVNGNGYLLEPQIVVLRM